MKYKNIFMALIVLSCPMISIFAKGKKKPHLQRIEVVNNYGSDVAFTFEWRDRHGAHIKNTTKETLKSGSHTVKAPLLGYYINKIVATPSSIEAAFAGTATAIAVAAVFTFGVAAAALPASAGVIAWQGRIHSHGNKFFVVTRGPIPAGATKGKLNHRCNIKGYSSKITYNAYQRINKVMSLKKKSDEAAAKAALPANNVVIQTTPGTTSPAVPALDPKTVAANALADYNAAVKALSPADATYFQALLTFQAAKKSANAMIPAQTESNQAVVQAATAAQTAAKAALPAAQKIFDAARQAFEKAQSTAPVVKGTAVVGTPAASADDSDDDFDGE